MLYRLFLVFLGFVKYPIRMRIVVRMPNWVGDCVMALPVLEDLHNMHQGEIVAVCRGHVGALLEHSPFVSAVVPEAVPGDIGYLLTNSLSSAWEFVKRGVRQRVGFFSWTRAPLLTKRVRRPKGIHTIDQYKQLIGSASKTKPRLYIPPGKKGERLRIGINPGAAYGSAKCWPPDRYRSVILRLLKELPCEIVVFGEVDLLGDLPVTNLVGKTTLRELVAEIGACDLLLTNDSGPMHIAAAMRVPVVALFGSTDPIATGPFVGKVLYKKTACSPCFKRECPIDFRCMRAIEVDEVVRAVQQEVSVLAR